MFVASHDAVEPSDSELGDDCLPAAAFVEGDRHVVTNFRLEDGGRSRRTCEQLVVQKAAEAASSLARMDGELDEVELSWRKPSLPLGVGHRTRDTLAPCLTVAPDVPVSEADAPAALLRGEKSEACAAGVTWKHPVEAVGCPWPHIEPKLLELRPHLAQKLGGRELHDRKRHEPIFADPQRATAIGWTAWYLWDMLVRLRERHEYRGIGGITFAETRASHIDKPTLALLTGSELVRQSAPGFECAPVARQ